MAIRYKGICKSLDDLPQRTPPVGAVPFKEPSPKWLAIVLNIVALAIAGLLAIPFMSLSGPYLYQDGAFPSFILGLVCALVAMVPHELLHASCFKEEVGVYLWPKGGAMFVLGLEDMSKGRFIFMSLLPNIVFGWVPFSVFLFFPQLVGLGVFGLIGTSGGAGDYVNAFNALTQVPKDAAIYMSGARTFWYRRTAA